VAVKRARSLANEVVDVKACAVDDPSSRLEFLRPLEDR
jgi:hypothetical protein